MLLAHDNQAGHAVHAIHVGHASPTGHAGPACDTGHQVQQDQPNHAHHLCLK